VNLINKVIHASRHAVLYPTIRRNSIGFSGICGPLTGIPLRFSRIALNLICGLAYCLQGAPRVSIDFKKRFGGKIIHGCGKTAGARNRPAETGSKPETARRLSENAFLVISKGAQRKEKSLESATYVAQDFSLSLEMTVLGKPPILKPES
jgi:hypothetical protein